MISSWVTDMARSLNNSRHFCGAIEQVFDLRFETWKIKWFEAIGNLLLTFEYAQQTFKQVRGVLRINQHAKLTINQRIAAAVTVPAQHRQPARRRFEKDEAEAF